MGISEYTVLYIGQKEKSIIFLWSNLVKISDDPMKMTRFKKREKNHSSSHATMGRYVMLCPP